MRLSIPWIPWSATEEAVSLCDQDKALYATVSSLRPD
jgi:hypothetical protein